MGSVGSNTQNKFLDSLTDNKDFRAWVRENLSNPEFKQFGRDNGMDEVQDLWRQKRAEAELKNIHEIPIEDAIELVKDNIRSSVITGWFREANSEYKPQLIDSVLTNDGVLNAGLNIAYHNYKYDMENHSKKPLDFKTWLITPIEMYRGTRGQKTMESDIFSSFTTDKKVAAGFTLSDSGSSTQRVKDDFSNIDMSKISTVKVRPIDTWGSYQTTGEQEYLIPSNKLKKKRG